MAAASNDDLKCFQFFYMKVFFSEAHIKFADYKSKCTELIKSKLLSAQYACKPLKVHLREDATPPHPLIADILGAVRLFS